MKENASSYILGVLYAMENLLSIILINSLNWNFFWIIGVKSYIVVVVEDFVFTLTFHIKVLLLNFFRFFLSGIYVLRNLIFRYHKMNWIFHFV